MDVAVVPLCEVEADVDMLPRLLVRVFVPGQTADDIAALFERLVEQFGGTGVTHDSFLRESDDLDIAIILVFLAYQQQSLRGTQSSDRSDVGEQPKERRSILDSALDHAPRTLRHFLRIVLSLEVVSYLDGFWQRAREVRPHDFTEQRFVGVQMQVDEARHNQVPRRIDHLGPLRGEIGSDGCDASALDPNIDRLVATT